MSKVVRHRMPLGLFLVSPVLFGLVFVMVVLPSWKKVEAGPVLAGHVNYLLGAAERKGTGGHWSTLAQGTKIFQGDRLRTKKSARLEAKLMDGSMLRLGGSSELRLRTTTYHRKTKKKSVSAHLFFGRAWAAVTTLFGRESRFEVTTKNAVAGVRGTRFSAKVSKDGTTEVKVYDGKVLVSNKPAYAIKGHTKTKRVQVAGPQEIDKKQWEEMVAGAMKVVRVASTGEISPAEDFKLTNAADDDWEQWNSERDKLAGIHDK